MGKLPLTTSRGASPPHDIVTAPQGQPVSRAMLCVATHLGPLDLLNAGSWFVDVSATALFVDVSIWLPFLHLLVGSDLVQERAFAHPVSSISFRADLPGSLSTLTWMSLLQPGNDAAPSVQLGGICQCPRPQVISVCWASSTRHPTQGVNLTPSLICFPCRPQGTSCSEACLLAENGTAQGMKGRKHYV
jgi:hypothetical protein